MTTTTTETARCDFPDRHAKYIHITASHIEIKGKADDLKFGENKLPFSPARSRLAMRVFLFSTRNRRAIKQAFTRDTLKGKAQKMQLRSIILLLSEILSELKALRKSVEEILRIQKGEDDSHANFISARKAAQILGIKTSRLWQIVGEYEAAGEKIRAGRNRYDAHKIRTIARLRAG